MQEQDGVYIMRIASRLSGMHPQTLRKYERAGFLTPSRSNSLRMYSDEDIIRLKMIKHLVDESGLNMAGIELALKLRDLVLEIQERVTDLNVTQRAERSIHGWFQDILELIETE
jgi:MerR family transcriptional regulator/heat shock protein HspR